MLENEEIEEPQSSPVKEIFQTFFKSYSAVTGLVILIGISDGLYRTITLSY